MDNTMKNKILSAIIQLILGGVGFALVWIYSSWIVALGVFLIIWGNNMQMMDNIKSMLKKILTDFIDKK